MRLKLLRMPTSSAGATPGDLYVDDKWFCYTLEDAIRPPWRKEAGKTAIPMGWYRIEISYSPRFQVRMPLLVDVPGFSGIRIHPGNGIADTDGCLLVGTHRGVNQITGSRAAYDRLFQAIVAAGDCDIKIFDPD